MKKKLLKQVEQIFIAVDTKIESIVISICDLDDSEDDFPVNIHRTHEYMVFSSLPWDSQLIFELKKKLSEFMGKKISVQKFCDRNWLIWGEGKSLVKLDPPEVSENQSERQQFDLCVFWLNTKTVLPAWLENELFQVHDARYDPNWKKFEHNLDLTEDELKVYLGSYFPRSYAEAFCILDNLFSNNVFKHVWINKDSVRILDIGCGSGGNLMGLLTALEKYCPNLNEIYIEAVDGSQLALAVLKQLLVAYELRTGKNVQVNLQLCSVNDVKDFPDMGEAKFDFISSFKMGCEIISKGQGRYDQAYYNLLDKYTPSLSATGIFFLLDVTTKADHADFYPRMMNQQVCKFIQTHSKFSTLVPIPCHLNEHQCNGDCFTQKEFEVSHRQAKFDKSRVCYRLMASRELVECILKKSPKDKYVICNKNGSRDWNTCSFFSDTGIVRDAYKLDK